MLNGELDRVRHGRSAAGEDVGGAFGGVEQRRRQDAEDEHRQRREADQTDDAACRRYGAGIGRILREHHTHDAQVIERGEAGVEHTDDHEPEEVGLNRRVEHVDLGDEAGGRRQAGERDEAEGEHQRRQGRAATSRGSRRSSRRRCAS